MLIKYWIKKAPHTTVQPVRYETAFPKVPIVLDDKEQKIYWVLDFLYTKSSEWEYEQEVRVFNKNNILPISFESINEIYFGCESSNNDRNDIINIVNKFKYKKVSFYKAQKSKTKFRLEFVALT